MGKKSKKGSAKESQNGKANESKSTQQKQEITKDDLESNSPKACVQDTTPTPEPDVPALADSPPKSDQTEPEEQHISANPTPKLSKPVSEPSTTASLHQEIGKLQAQLQAVESERDDIQDQYDELLDKVAHIKTTLGQRLKTDAATLANLREELEEANNQTVALTAQKKGAEDQLSEIQKKYDAEHANLGYTELQLAEKDEKISTLEARVAQLEEDVEQQTNYAEHYRKSHLSSTQSSEELEKELTKKLEKEQAAHNETKSQLQAHESQLSKLNEELETLRETLDKSSSKAATVDELNESIREKNIQIGKLRHEAVILNEHLTNALRIVKKDSEGQTVDKELVSNLIVQFVTIPRGDTKKFEVLQLISSFLNWDEDRRVEAGLSKSQQSGKQSNLGGFLGKFAEFMERESRKTG